MLSDSNLKKSLVAYVINLESRPDRWESVLSQTQNLGLDVVKVVAFDSLDIDPSIERYVPPGVAATWKSHQLAMSQMLASESSHGLILEDDFLVKRDISKIVAQVESTGEYDLIQIGFLSPSLTRRFIRHIIGIRDVTLKLLLKCDKFLNIGFSKKLIIREQSDVPFAFVLNDIQAGGHAYMVSRRFCEAAQFMNIPAYLSADGMLMALSETRTFRVARTRRNFIKQSDSITSVQERFKRAI